jgi:uncharacterized protein YdeI (YjbR/CyaY-like superfamily)
MKEAELNRNIYIKSRQIENKTKELQEENSKIKKYSKQVEELEKRNLLVAPPETKEETQIPIDILSFKYSINPLSEEYVYKKLHEDIEEFTQWAKKQAEQAKQIRDKLIEEIREIVNQISTSLNYAMDTIGAS